MGVIGSNCGVVTWAGGRFSWAPGVEAVACCPERVVGIFEERELWHISVGDRVCRKDRDAEGFNGCCHRHCDGRALSALQNPGPDSCGSGVYPKCLWGRMQQLTSAEWSMVVHKMAIPRTLK